MSGDAVVIDRHTHARQVGSGQRVEGEQVQEQFGWFCLEINKEQTATVAVG
jgi:hypothetical protein